MCGEKSPLRAATAPRPGSPPRVRGKAVSDIVVTYEPGITPACAGKSLKSPAAMPSFRDHPRVCGEKYSMKTPESIAAGSPPRVRGKADVSGPEQGRDGITPACAGKRTGLPCRSPPRRDHPRVCGEKCFQLLILPDHIGSPPRVRGKEKSLCTILYDYRITPACAGKSTTPRRQAPTLRDHPRVCGEKDVLPLGHVAGSGSPPRVRGKGQMAGTDALPGGITPACAWKRRLSTPGCAACEDHPRVCGEKPALQKGRQGTAGSPPRVRGKGVNSRYKWVGVGITPACAGKRLKRSHSIGHFSCILCLFHSVLHRASVSGGSRAGPCAPPCLPAQNAVPV